MEEEDYKEEEHDCYGHAELVNGSDGLMFWECSWCLKELSGFVGQFGVLWDTSEPRKR